MNDRGAEKPRRLRRDQQLALYAYRAADRALGDKTIKFDEYKIAVQNFGATALRSGLAMAMAELERTSKRKAVQQLRDDLAGAPIFGLGDCDGKSLPDHVRNLEARPYMLVTREMRQVVEWLVRAVQANAPDDKSQDEQEGEKDAT